MTVEIRESVAVSPTCLVGRPAPEFRMPCTETPSHSGPVAELRDFRGRWLILLFYPRDFSLICPTELTAIGDRIDEFHARGCAVIGVSTDSIATHESWVATPRAEGGLGHVDLPLASDEAGEVSSAYGVYLEYQHAALRAAFIIDPNGVVQYESVHNLNVGRSSDEVMRILEALQTGGMCPEDWCPDRPTMDPTETLGAGRVVSHYRVEAEVGRGSSAAVFRALDTKLQRPVALKAFKPEVLAGEDGVLAEAAAAAALNHPNVCTIYGVDDSAGFPVIVMEYVDGDTLHHRMAERDLDLDEVASIVAGVASGMALAHKIGIVHGDLKPSNIILTRDGSPKITDFGLSRRELVVSSNDDTSGQQAAAHRGICGTPSYMSPEQTNGAPASAAGDVFALGVVMYELISGQRAFAADNILEIFHQVRGIQPAALAAELPAPFAALAQAALVQEPRARASMAEIADALT